MVLLIAESDSAGASAAWATWVGASAAWATFVAACIYTWFTIKQFRILRSQQEPYVVLYVKTINKSSSQKGDSCELVLENTGRETAFDVSCSVVGNENLSKNVLDRPSEQLARKILAPGQRISRAFEMPSFVHQLLEKQSGEDGPVSVSVKWSMKPGSIERSRQSQVSIKRVYEITQD